jgi:hypothetical protein
MTKHRKINERKAPHSRSIPLRAVEIAREHGITEAVNRTGVNCNSLYAYMIRHGIPRKRLSNAGGTCPPKLRGWSRQKLADAIRAKIKDPHLQSWVACVAAGDLDIAGKGDDLAELIDAYPRRHRLADEDLRLGLEAIGYPDPESRARRGERVKKKRKTA